MNANANLEACAAAGRRALARRFLAAWVAGGLLATAAAADMFQPVPTPGGIDPRARVTGLTRNGSNATLSWYGPLGPYQVQMTPTLSPPAWATVANLTVSAYANSLTLSNLSGLQGYFRLSPPPNSYVGAGGCAGCHGDQYFTWWRTGHATAYSSIAAVPPATRQTCLPCHTTGAGQASGFADLPTTPYLSNVGCENCHGPGAAHKYGEHDLVHPIVTIAAEVCGGCHTGAQQPTYDEWKASGHGQNAVLREIAGELADPSYQLRCGPCHSGAVRAAMLANYEDALSGFSDVLRLPSTGDVTNFGVVCVTCHDPHARDRDHQLRNPVCSTNFFSFFTGAATTNLYYTNFQGVITTNTWPANSVFAAQYNPAIQICAQCHNDRGATWQSSSRPPHHSPQYNLLIGAVQTNYLNGTNLTLIGSHGLNTNGCVQCHMHSFTVASPTGANPNDTGHRFDVSLAGCVLAGCHATANEASALLAATALATTNRITELVGLLNQWAVSKSLPVLRTNYGALAWEYTAPGTLSQAGTNAGPSSARQAAIPNAIKQARFNLYLVFHDGSLGSHNEAYARFLLDNARTNVVLELNRP
jgi:hypothetical protein